MYLGLVAMAIAATGGMLLLRFVYPDFYWHNEPVHSTLEALGAFAAIAMAMVLLQGKSEDGGSILFLLAMGFIGMGILDGFHALSPPGNVFVFLHSIAGLVGSLWVVSVWRPDFGRYISGKTWVLWVVSGSSLLLGILALLLPDVLPTMISQGGFTRTAIVINLFAGILFLVGALRFLLDFHHSGETRDYTISYMIVFFGLAGITFTYSLVWDGAWWLWHLLRLMAYIVVLGFVVNQFLNTGIQLKATIGLYKRAEESTRRSEENFRSLVENSINGILIVRNQIIQYANKRFVEIVGYQLPELIGHKSRGFLRNDRPERREILAEVHGRRMAGDPRAQTYETVYRRKDGSDVPVEISRASTTWENQDASLFIIKDISDRKHLEEERTRSIKLESLGVLAGGIAHDFNNLLTGIMGNAGLGKLKSKDEDVRQILQQIENVAGSATGLTHQLLTFARGGGPIRKPQPIGRLIQDSVNFALRGSNVSTVHDIPEDLWQADVDAGQIGQVINNIAINADQSMPEGGNISVKAENVTFGPYQVPDLSKGNYVKISVTDNGIGIPEGIKGNIFDPYFSTKSTGSGLGLATTWSIIQKHDGIITVDSEVDGGTTFTIYLPAIKKTATTKKTPKEQVHLGGRILVMDDEQYILELVRRGLGDMGYDVDVVADGDAAVEAFSKAIDDSMPYDVVIMDLTIPGGKGGKLAIKELRQLNPDVRAIVSSGFSNDPVIAEPEKYGFAGVLTKPFTMDALGEVMQEVLKK